MSVFRFHDDPPRFVEFNHGRRRSHKATFSFGFHLNVTVGNWGKCFGTRGGLKYDYQRRGCKIELRVGRFWCSWLFRWVGNVRQTYDMRSPRKRQVDRELARVA